MAFQGFAREEQFSTNQIKIDIGSVIENDLAEANRQSKYMAKNSAMGEKWRGMYLNAMINKHEVEKRNREDNFKFFMDNRAAIQKQVEYNNEVKAKDAERSHPHIKGLDSILGEGLLDLAVNLGGSAIKGAIARSGEAEAAQKKKTLEFVKLASLKASKEQNEMRRDPEFIKRLRSDVEGVSKAAIAEYNAAGDHKAGINFVQNVYRAHKLDVVDKDNTFHSERLTAIAYQTYVERFTWNHNGAEITWSDIQAGRYPGSGDAFLDAAEKSFYEERGIHNVGVGAQARAALGIHSITAQAQRIIKNNQYKRDTKDYEIQLVSTLESHPGTTSELIQFVTDPNGTHIGSRKTRGEALEWLRNHWENYGSSGRIREAMAASYPGVESINEGAPSARHPAGTKKWQDWNASLAIAVAREEQGRQNTQSEYDGQFNQWTAEANQGLLSPQDARNRLEFFKNGGQLNQQLAGASPQVQKSFMEALRNAAGYGGEAPAITAGQQFVNDNITHTEGVDIGKALIRNTDGKRVPLKGIPTEDMKMIDRNVSDAVTSWAAETADYLIAQGMDPARPGEIEKEINRIVTEKTSLLNPLLHKLEATFDPNNPTIPQFENMQKARGVGEKGFQQTYTEKRLNAMNNGKHFGLREAFSGPIDHEEVHNFMSVVDKAKRYKHIDLQNVLSNAPKWVREVVRTQKFSSAGQVYQAILDYAEGYGDKYTRLSESDYMDYIEVKQQYDVLGSQLSKLDQRTQAVITARHTANGGFTPNARVRNIADNLGIVEAIGPEGLGVQGVREKRDHSKENAHMHYGYGSRKQRDAHSSWIISEFKRRHGITLRVNYDEGRVDPNSLHGKGLAADWAGDNFPVGQELWGLRELAKIANEWPGLQTQLPPLTVGQETLPSNVVLTDPTEVRHAGPGTPGYGHGGTVAPDKQIPTGWRRWAAGGADFVAKQLGLESIDLDRRGN